MNSIKISTYLLLTALLFGCESWPGQKPEPSDGGVTALDRFTAEHHKLIADNLLDVISQFNEVPPLTTTVQISHAQTPFGRAVQRGIVDAGYGTQAVDGDMGVNLIRYLAENAETEQGFRTRYRIEVGDYFAERDYQLVNRIVIPTSEMRVGGSQQENIAVNDTGFDTELIDNALSYVSSSSTAEPEIRVLAFDRGSFKLDETKPELSTGIFANASSLKQGVEAVTGKNNMYLTGDSNFKNIFENYEDTGSGILVFANDSLVLGNRNKSYLSKLAKSFDSQTEVISVIGCSHGATDLDNGNEKLANGRANRVKQALIIAGVDEDRIYDEGCWASEYFDEVMPRRGVLITRKKLIDNG